ncbi:hypothetical protein FIBSPDRAFT_874179, partial [Athelia psychrophila]
IATRLSVVMLLQWGPHQDPAHMCYLAGPAAMCKHNLLTPFRRPLQPSPSSTALIGTSLYPLARARLVWACHLKVDPTNLWAYCRQDSDLRQSEW